MSEFGAMIAPGCRPEIAPVPFFERFEGHGLKAAEPVALLLVLSAPVTFVLLRGALVLGGLRMN